MQSLKLQLRLVLSKTMTRESFSAAAVRLNAELWSLLAWMEALLFGSFVRRGAVHVKPKQCKHGITFPGGHKISLVAYRCQTNLPRRYFPFADHERTP